MLQLIERIMVLARQVYNVDPATGRFVASDESARAPLQAAVVSLRALVEAQTDHLPQVLELSRQGTRDNSSVQRIQGLYLAAVDEVRARLLTLDLL
jgi:hypothetical protein